MKTVNPTARGGAIRWSRRASPHSGQPAQAPPARRARHLRVLLAVAAVAALAGLAAYRLEHHNHRRFQEVRPGVLYRTGAPSEYGLGRLARQYGLKTVLCLHEDTPRLKAGIFFDAGDPSGRLEAECAAELGIRFLHWPLVDEAHWPWPTPWHIEQFYRLFDDPANWPVLVHCRAGKHRAGTMAALFRLEYDRWTPEATLDEMYSFGFGTPRAIQEHNLRTYAARPRPDPAQWDALAAAFGGPLGSPPPADYDDLVRRLRAGRSEPGVRDALAAHLEQGRAFAVCLAARLIDRADDPLVPAAARLARSRLEAAEATADEWAAAAALTADFGPREARKHLLELLAGGSKTAAPTLRYQAVAAGVTGRYARNRIAYLKPLLDDLRQRPEPAAAVYRYADTAVARLTSIADVDLLGDRGPADREDWDRGIEAARQWFAAHPDAAEPSDYEAPQAPFRVPGQ